MSRAKKKQLARRRFELESLERRNMMATFGEPWANPSHLTLSFVPDGTPIAGHASNLFAALDAQYTRDVWQRDILRAVQTWTSVTNIDVAVVPDSGLPLGTRGREQGDSRFGDIRIAGHVMAPDSLSISVPNDPFSPERGRATF